MLFLYHIFVSQLNQKKQFAMKKIIFAVVAMVLFSVNADAQAFMNRLQNAAKNAAENAAENAVERNVDRKVNEGVDNAFEGNKRDKSEKAEKKTNKSDDVNSSSEVSGWTCEKCGFSGNAGKFCNECGEKKPEAKADNGWTCEKCGANGNTGKFCNECGEKKPEAAADNSWNCQKCGAKGNKGNFCNECGAKKGERKIESTYSKSDFVPGDEIIFSDDFANEKIGEFPSKWDLLRGVSEVVKFDGRMAIDFQDNNTRVAPLMKNPHNYLTDEFTVELDFFAGDNSTIKEGLYSRSHYKMEFISEEDGRVMEFYWHTADVKEVQCWYTSTNGDGRSSDADISALLVDGTWNHLAISFNKRAFKAYINGTRVINIPNMKAPNYLELESRLWSDHGVNYISDIRIAKGAVPLYDRLTTDGMIVTYGITFEVGKATLKPEADVEINRIKGLMDQDASLKFEVQGHCDNTGSTDVNNKLSQQRAEAIVARLVELGIDGSRLTAVGKGSSDPIADNSTDEGRAKNRRVVFIKK